LSLQVVEDGLQRLSFQWNAVAPPRPQFFDNLKVRVVLDAGDEPAAVLVDAVEESEIVKAQIKQYKSVRYPFSGG